MFASSEREQPAGTDRDTLEGTYTQAEPETAEHRAVHGQYTETEEAAPDTTVEGTYIGAEREGKEPLVRDAALRKGNYPKAEH